MKKFVKTTLLFGIFFVLMCVAAFAADTGFEVTTPDSTGKTEVAVNGDKLTVTVKNAPAGQYMVILVEGSSGEAPSKSNEIYYIDQNAGEDKDLTFTVIPKLPNSESVTLFVTSGVDGYKNLRTVLSYTPSYVLGDLNDDGKVNSQDALVILRATVHQVDLTEQQKLAADVNFDGKQNSQDALKILRFVVHQITEEQFRSK